MRIVLNGQEIRSEADFHRIIAHQLDFPAYYGHNLDALWDCVSGDVKRPTHLVWEHSSASREALGTLFQKIVDVLTAAAHRDEQSEPDDRFTFELA